MKFSPVFDDRFWGGQKIRSVLGLDFSPAERCAEAWILSGYHDKQTVVSNGFLAGNELNELVEVYMDDLVGEAVHTRYGNVFPLLVKFIDARDWLSIQVHPDDDVARRHGLPHGKTEMWYVIDADPGAMLVSGFSRQVSREAFLEKLNRKQLQEILNYEKVSAGDVFFMPAGRIHALGPGVLLAEIQQTSDATYRIYDFDRTDRQGKPRELHIDLALEAIDFKTYPEYKTAGGDRPGSSSLLSCPHFSVNLIDLAHPLQKNYEELDSFVIYVCLEGSMTLAYRDQAGVPLRKGEVVLLPASLDLIRLFPQGNTRLLEVYV